MMCLLLNKKLTDVNYSLTAVAEELQMHFIQQGHKLLTVFVLVICATVQAHHDTKVEVQYKNDGYDEEKHRLENVIPAVQLFA